MSLLKLAQAAFRVEESFDNYTIPPFLADGELVPFPVRLFNYVESTLEPTVRPSRRP